MHESPQFPPVESVQSGIYSDPEFSVDRQLRLGAMYELYMERHAAITSERDFYSYQQDTLDSLRTCLGVRTHQGADSINVANISATGTGKSVTALTALWATGTGHEIHGQLSRALWIAPENHLFENVSRARDVLGLDLLISNWSGGKREAFGDIITINTLTFAQEWKRYLAGQDSSIPFNEIDSAVIDEAHLALGELGAAQLATFQKGRFTFANTATPWLKSGKNILELWPDIIAYLDLRQAIEVYGITKNDRPLTFYTLSPKETITIDGLTRSGDLKESDLEQIFDSESLKDFTARLAMMLSKHNCKTMFFTPRGANSKFARDMEERLNGVVLDVTDEKTLTARAIGSFDSTTSGEALRDFDEGKVDVVFSSKMAEIGYDGQTTNVVVLMTEITSHSTAVQRIGRLLHNNDGEAPLIVIFVNYRIFNKSSNHYVKPLSPADLFDLPYQAITALEPKSDAQPYITSMSDIMRRVPQASHNSRITDFRTSHPRPQSRNKNASAAPIVPLILRQEIETLVAQNPLIVTDEQKILPNTRQELGEDEHSVEEISRVAGMDASYLAKILRQEKQRVTSRTINNTRLESCEESSAEVLDAVVATNGEYSARYVADALKVALSTVRRNIVAVSKDLPASETTYVNRYSRQYVPNERGIALKERHYGKVLIDAVFDYRSKLAVSKRQTERSLPEIVNACGRDPKHVYDYMTAKGYTPSQRAVQGASYSVNCYELSDEEFDELVDRLKLPPDLPNSTDYINTSQIASRFLSHLGFTRQDLDTLLGTIEFPSFEFNMAGNKQAIFIEKTQVKAFVEFVKQYFAAGELRGSKPPRNQRAETASGPVTPVASPVISAPPVANPPIEELTRAHLSNKRFGVLPKDADPRPIVPIESLVRIHRTSVDVLVAIARNHKGIKEPTIGTDSKDMVVLDQNTYNRLGTFLRNKTLPGVPSTWRWAETIAECYDLNTIELLRLLSSGRFGSNHVRIIYDQDLTRKLIFCSPSIIASILSKAQKHY